MVHPTSSITASSGTSRLLIDKAARYAISTGGVMVLVTLLLILGYLLSVIFPVFGSATLTEAGRVQLDSETHTQQLVLSGRDVGIRVTRNNALDVYDLTQQKRVQTHRVNSPITSSAYHSGLLVLAFDNGNIRGIKPEALGTTKGLERFFSPRGVKLSSEPLTELTLSVEDGAFLLGAKTLGGQLVFVHSRALEEPLQLPDAPQQVDSFKITPDLSRIFILKQDKLWVYRLDLGAPQLMGIHTVNETGYHATALTLLPGGASVLVTNDNGVVSQWFEVVKTRGREFSRIREFNFDDKVLKVIAAPTGRSFMVFDDNEHAHLMFATTGDVLWHGRLSATAEFVAWSDDAKAVWVQEGEALVAYALDNPYPQVSWRALWQKVWYEGYPEPDYVWQSTSATDDYEAKYSLVPLSMGTLKAAFYAMLFAVPLALCSAIYTAYFMAPTARKFVKPGIEMMEALPTVIIGFLAGLWLAPVVESNLTGVLTGLVLIPLGIVSFGYCWSLLPLNWRRSFPDGWDMLLLVPVILGMAFAAAWLSPWVEFTLFGGNIRDFISNELGISFDQRNSLVIGIAMGFAVIPTIFSIAEDAIFSVPKPLSSGSLALGATRWQTLTKVVLLTASPGIFSAIMMGLGRAVGETMIVLMATGNTPIMDLSIFNGMRTLSANIAIEMPESEVGSAHYRILFLAAFVLFCLTFVFNTLAELVRQRLRERYNTMAGG